MTLYHKSRKYNIIHIDFKLANNYVNRIERKLRKPNYFKGKLMRN